MTLSRAAQMRRKKAEGFTTGEIARLFGVDYHIAYNAVVVGRGQTGREVETREDPLSDAVLQRLTWWQILTVTEGPATTKAERGRRLAYRREADNRDPSGNNYEKRKREWERAGRPAE